MLAPRLTLPHSTSYVNVRVRGGEVRRTLVSDADVPSLVRSIRSARGLTQAALFLGAVSA